MTLHIVGIDTRISLIYQTEFIQGYSRHLRVCQIKALRVQFVRGKRKRKRKKKPGNV